MLVAAEPADAGHGDNLTGDARVRRALVAAVQQVEECHGAEVRASDVHFKRLRVIRGFRAFPQHVLQDANVAVVLATLHQAKRDTRVVHEHVHKAVPRAHDLCDREQ